MQDEEGKQTIIDGQIKLIHKQLREIAKMIARGEASYSDFMKNVERLKRKWELEDCDD